MFLLLFVERVKINRNNVDLILKSQSNLKQKFCSGTYRIKPRIIITPHKYATATKDTKTDSPDDSKLKRLNRRHKRDKRVKSC